MIEGWTFKIGDKVRKKSGSHWHGTVVGYYTNPPYTPEGYNVASDLEHGNVQVYPLRALEPWDGVTYRTRQEQTYD